MDKESEEKLKCMSMDEGSEIGSKSVVVVSNPGSIHMLLKVNTEAWDKVMQSFRDLDRAINAGLESVKPLMQEAARQQSATLEQFRKECLGEWIQPAGQVFTLEALRELQERQQIERIREEEGHARIRAIFADTPLSFSIQSEPIKTLKELCDEARLKGFFPELQAKIDIAQKEQVQLHKKKGKKVKNWEHNKFWHGRK